MLATQKRRLCLIFYRETHLDRAKLFDRAESLRPKKKLHTLCFLFALFEKRAGAYFNYLIIQECEFFERLQNLLDLDQLILALIFRFGVVLV